MKFGQLIECNTRNIFLEKSYTNCGVETRPRPFSEKLNWPYIWINGLKFFAVCFYCMQSWGLSKYTETKLQLSNIETKQLVFLPHHFPHNFWKKIFLCLNFINCQISLSGCFYFAKYLAICVLQLFVNQVMRLWILKQNLPF